MMHTDSEQSAIDIMNAIPINTIKSGDTPREDKTPLIETRYAKWKRTRKVKSGWLVWFCWCLTSIRGIVPLEGQIHYIASALVIEDFQDMRP